MKKRKKKKERNKKKERGPEVDTYICTRVYGYPYIYIHNDCSVTLDTI